MRFLLYAILAAVVGWSAYWFIGSTGVDRALSHWFEERRAENWQAEYSDLSVKGYPNRFDIGLSDLALADPKTGLSWQTPYFEVNSLSYRPTHLIAVWPEKHVIATPLATFDITSEDMRASLIVKALAHMRLDRTTITADQFGVTERGSNEGVRMDKLALAAELVDAPDWPTYRLGLTAADVALSEALQRTLDPKERLPEGFGGLKADMTVGFDRVWDRTAIEDSRPQPRRIDIHLAEASWGELLLQAAGKLDIDEAGVPTGEITVKAENWRDMLQIARESGKIPEPLFKPIESGLKLIAKMSGNRNALDVPLTFKKGSVRLGPIPIAKAPVIRLR